MPLIDDLKLPATEDELTRRKLLGLLGSGALAVAGIGTAVTAIRFLEPSVLFEEDTRFSLGRPEEIPLGTVLAIPKRKVFVLHGAEGFVALSMVCTHLGCMTRYQPEATTFACPCHGSRFALDGHVTGGPAPRPLPRFVLEVERGQLFVDTARVAEPTAVLRVS